MIILNFSQAFDKVPHQKLLSNLYNYGIRGNIWRWVSASLSNRVQQVVFDGEVSNAGQMLVVSGISPWASSNFILNKSPSFTISKTMRFADDCIFYRLIHDQNDCIILPKEFDAVDLDMLWGCNFIPKDIVLSASQDTTHQVKYNYTLKGHTLESIMAVKYLGLTLP